MRITYFKKVNVQRSIQYDPDFHGLVDNKVDILIESQKDTSDRLRVQIKLAIRYSIKGSGAEMGTIEAEAESLVTGVPVPWLPNGGIDGEKVSEELKRVIEGAVAEDVMLPLSIVARGAHLPSLLPIPMLFPRNQIVGEPPAGPQAPGPQRRARTSRKVAGPA
jgi:hypothetical protein